MLCIGHRGAMGYEPENTLLAIAKALSLGVDWIEIDVHNVENNLIVFHDRCLERTTNGTGYICDRYLFFSLSIIEIDFVTFSGKITTKFPVFALLNPVFIASASSRIV